MDRPINDNDVLFDFNTEFKTQSDVIYVPIIKGNAKERTGYPTQKPLALYEKLVTVASNLGDIVLDHSAGVPQHRSRRNGSADNGSESTSGTKHTSLSSNVCVTKG